MFEYKTLDDTKIFIPHSPTGKELEDIFRDLDEDFKKIEKETKNTITLDESNIYINGKSLDEIIKPMTKALEKIISDAVYKAIKEEFKKQFEKE